MKLIVNKTLTMILVLVLTVAALMTSIVPVNSQDDRSDLLQYEWPTPDGDLSLGFLTADGPAPSTQDILWTSDLGEPQSAFNGLVFLTGGWAVDGFTGNPKYEYLGSSATKISETQFITAARPSMFSPVKIGQIYVYETNTGRLLHQYSIPNGIPAARSGALAYNQDLGMFWTLQGEPFFGTDHILYAWDWSNVAQEPTIKWEKTIPKGMGTKEFFDGYIFIGTREMTCICFDAETGDLLWEIPLEGDLGYSGSYYEGKYIHATFDQIYCIEAATGNVLWTFNAGTFWNFWANMGAIYNGVIYNINTDYFTYALDIETGDIVWKFESEQGSGYQGPTIAGGGYVYAYTGRAGDVYHDVNTGVPFEDEYVCLDAETGELMWKTDTVSGGGGGGPPGINNILAYGNLYTQSTFALTVCYGPTQSWSSFKGNAANTGDGGVNGPGKLDVKWISQVDSAILTSPVAANNKIYVGTVLGTFYAFDHITGDIVWTFKTDEDMKLSSPEYDSGRIFFASDNGYQYCLDAETGDELWKTYIGSDTLFLFHGRYRKTSSPTVVNNRLYVGSTDFNLYCLNAASGSRIWSKDLGGLISSTPAVSDGALYIPVGGISSTTNAGSDDENGTLFKLDAGSGSVIWESELPYVYAGGRGFGQWQPREFHGSPCVADGMVFQSANAWTTYAVNATTGNLLWNYTIYAGGMQNDMTPAYSDGKLYVQSFFSLVCLNTVDGSVLWEHWGGHAVHGDPIVTVDKVYYASDQKVMWSLDADTGEQIDFIAWEDICYSAACIYDGKLYWGTAGMKLFCFEEAAVPTLSSAAIDLSLSKNTVVKGDIVYIEGRTTNVQAAIPLTVTVDRPDSTFDDISIMTDENGYFQVIYTPDITGDLTVVAWCADGDFYEAGASDTLSLSVVDPEPVSTPEPTPMPMTDTYLTGSTIAILAGIAIAVFLILRKK